MSDTQAYPDDYQPQTPAERMRRHRERKREGKTLVQVEIFDREVRAFSKMGLLPRELPVDREDIAEAIYKILDKHLRKTA